MSARAVAGRRRRRDARPAGGRAGERRRGHRGRPGARAGRLDRLARRRRAGAPGDRPGDCARRDAGRHAGADRHVRRDAVEPGGDLPGARPRRGRDRREPADAAEAGDAAASPDSLHEVARTVREHGQGAVWVASELLEKRVRPPSDTRGRRPQRPGPARPRRRALRADRLQVRRADPRQPARPHGGRQEPDGRPAAGGVARIDVARSTPKAQTPTPRSTRWPLWWTPASGRVCDASPRQVRASSAASPRVRPCCSCAADARCACRWPTRGSTTRWRGSSARGSDRGSRSRPFAAS